MKWIVLSLCFSPLLAFCDVPAPTATNTDDQNAPGMSETETAMDIRNSLISIHDGDTSQASWDAVRAKIDKYQKQFGVSPSTTKNVLMLRKYELKVAKKSTDPARYTALVAQLAKDPLPEVAEMAKQQMAMQARLENLKTAPVDLKFTAVDGKPVDLAALRGKVILLDFWASWDQATEGEAPIIADIYKKHHGEGFEVIGISLDEDKSALLSFAKQNEMVWPEYFDGKKWDNEISSSFDIHSIPALWLFDKKGMLVTTKPDADLEGQIEGLLKAP